MIQYKGYDKYDLVHIPHQSSSLAAASSLVDSSSYRLLFDSESDMDIKKGG